jgi:hypothetical protein
MILDPPKKIKVLNIHISSIIIVFMSNLPEAPKIRTALLFLSTTIEISLVN